MTGLAILASPQPVDISIRSSLSTDDILGRLARAIGDYYRTDVQSPRYLGLGGSVAAGWVKLTVRPYLSPGEPQTRGMVPLVMVGQVVPTADGGEIRGQVTAPLRSAETRVFALVMLLWLIVGFSGGPTTRVLAVTGTVVVAIVWAWVIRHNQRSALDRVGLFVRFLESIVSPETSTDRAAV